jgi:hypothetical protein
MYVVLALVSCRKQVHKIEKKTIKKSNENISLPCSPLNKKYAQTVR